MAHLTFDSLTDYLKNQLAEPARGHVEAHLTDCLLCQQELARVQHFVQQVQGDVLERPRAELTQNILTAIARQLKQRLQLPLHSIKPDFDSWATPTPYALRGATQERQLLYSVEKGDIDLQVAYDKEAHLFALRGQILAAPAPTAESAEQLTPSPDTALRGLVVRLFTNHLLLRQAVTDELGYFRFSELAAGLYALQVDWHDQRVQIDAIPLSA